MRRASFLQPAFLRSLVSKAKGKLPPSELARWANEASNKDGNTALHDAMEFDAKMEAIG